MSHEEIRELARVLADEMNRYGKPAAPDSAPLTVEEFAHAVGRSPDWVYDQIRRGKVRRCKCGKPYRIPRTEVQRILSP